MVRQAVSPPSNLAERVMARLSADIRGGRLAPGARLPTEQALTSTHGREPHRRARGGRRPARRRAGGDAARLRRLCRRESDGRRRSASSPRRLRPHRAMCSTSMELRLAVEVEAAAPRRRRAPSRKHVAKVRAALRDIDRALQGGEGAVAEDFAFHRAIAEATGNRAVPALPRLPRQPCHSAPERAAVGRHAGRAAGLSRAHPARARAASWRALPTGNPVEARRAMRDHLTRSLERYRKLAEGSKP